MHPALAFTGTHGPGLAAWLLANADALGAAFARLAHPVTAALTDPAAALDRIGATLVARRDGQVEVIGLLHRHSSQLDALTAEIDSVGPRLGYLSFLSAAGLGLSALTQAHLAVQFSALTRRLDRLLAESRELKALLHADLRGGLAAGLAQLQNALDSPADPATAAGLLHAAGDNLTTSAAKYGALVRDGVADPAAAGELARHLAVAVRGEAAVYLHLGRPDLAVRSLRAGLDPLRAHARAAFARTVGAAPEAYLIPALAGHGVTLEVVAELLRQARLAGVADPGAATAADLFEAVRDRLPADPLFGRAAKAGRLRAAFAAAAEAVEGVNRVAGLALAVEHCRREGRDYLGLAAEIVAEVAERGAAEGDCFAVFPTPPAATVG